MSKILPDNTITISKDEYDVLLDMISVNNEHLQGKKETFLSAEDLIQNPFHSKLHTHKLQGRWKDCYSFR